MPHHELSNIPDRLLQRSDRPAVQARTARDLAAWLAAHGVRASLLDIENERARRANPQTTATPAAHRGPRRITTRTTR